MTDSVLHPFLTIEQACERAQVGRNTVKAWIKQGMPVMRLGPRMIRIDVDAFDQWLKEKGTENHVGTFVGTLYPQEGSGVVFKEKWSPKK